MFGLKTNKLHKELKFNFEVKEASIDLLASDLTFHKEYLSKIKNNLTKNDLLNGEEKSFFSVNAKPSEIKAIMKLWLSLKKGEPMRCFIPGYKLSFHGSDNVKATVTICWSCNHIKILDTNENESWLSFDGEAIEAHELLALVRSIVASRM